MLFLAYPAMRRLSLKGLFLALVLPRTLSAPAPPTGQAEDLGKGVAEAVSDSSRHELASLFYPASHSSAPQDGGSSATTSKFWPTVDRNDEGSSYSALGAHTHRNAPPWAPTLPDFHSSSASSGPYQYGYIPTVVYHPVLFQPEQYQNDLRSSLESGSTIPMTLQPLFLKDVGTLKAQASHHDLSRQSLEEHSSFPQYRPPPLPSQEPNVPPHVLDSSSSVFKATGRQPTVQSASPFSEHLRAPDSVAQIGASERSQQAPPLLPVPILRPTRGKALDYRHLSRLPRGKKGKASLVRFNRDRLDLLGGSPAQIRSIAVQDPNFFSGASFETILQRDPEIDRFIESLRLPESRIGRGESLRDLGPAPLTTSEVEDPNSIARKTFYYRKEAKQVLYGSSEDPRSLFLTFIPGQRRVSGKLAAGHVAVWEIGPLQEADAVGLYLRGFYRFTAAEFQALDRSQHVSGKKFWIMRMRLNEPHGRLSIVPSSSRETEAQQIPGSELPDHPEIKALAQTGQLDRALSVGKLLHGRHLYVYQESPQLRPLIESWKKAAGLAGDSFEPIPLRTDQIDNLATNMASHYRRPKPVKVIERPNGEMYVLSFLLSLSWLQQHPRDVVAVWKMGPRIQNKRLMIAQGFFGVDPSTLSKMTPDTVAGLHDSTFQYNLAGLP